MRSLRRTFLVLTFALPNTVMAQRVSRPIQVSEHVARRDVHVSVLRQEQRTGMPRWVKWGLVGAAAGAVTFAVLSEAASTDQTRGGVVGDAATGAVAGFVIVGGSILAWDAVCGGEKRSRRPVLCGR